MLQWGIRLGWRSAAHPGSTLALMLALVLAMVPGLFRLRLATDGHSLVPPDEPAIAVDSEARRHFGLRDPLLVVLDTGRPAGIFDAGTLDRLARLTRDLQALPGVGADDVVSLATEHAPRFAPGSYEFQPLLAPPLRSPQRLAEIREDVEAIDIFRGTLVSYDRGAAAILVGVPAPGDGTGAGIGKTVDRTALYHRIVATTRPYAAAGQRISVVGAPAAEAMLGEEVLKDLALLVPLALAVIATVLWLSCGRTWALIVGLAKIGAAQVFTLGLIGWSGQPVYLTTAILPVLLTTVGLSDEIHLLWRYRHRVAGEEPAAALRRAFQEVGRPIILTSLTTAAGFLSFLTSSIRPVWSFGLFAGAGCLFCLLWALTGTPALIALRPRAIPVAVPRTAGDRLVRPALALGARPRLVLPALALVTAGLALGIPRLVVEDGWIANFSPRSPLRRATEQIDRQFAGTHELLVTLTFDPPADQVPSIPAARGPLLATSTIAAIGRFEQGLRARPEVGGVFGLSSHLLTTAYLWGGKREEARQIFDNPSWIYLHIRRIGNVRGVARRRELVDDDLRRTVVTVLLKGASFQRTAAVVAAVRDLERRELAPVHGRADLAGDVAVSQTMIPAIVRTQVGSLLMALAGNLLIVVLLFRSLRQGLITLLPTALAVAWTFGLMGWLGIPLGVATSIFCAVTLGIGVDYGIHFLERFRAAEAAGEPRPDRVASAQAGPAILIDTLAIALGFGLLAVSRLPADRRLGLLVAVGLASLLSAYPRRPGSRARARRAAAARGPDHSRRGSGRRGAGRGGGVTVPRSRGPPAGRWPRLVEARSETSSRRSDMIRLSSRALVLATLLVVLAALPASAQINPGKDFWTTPANGQTVFTFPAGDVEALCGAVPSNTWNHSVAFQGVPLGTSSQPPYDTVVSRLDKVAFNSDGVGTTRIQVSGLSFVSINPQSTPCGVLTWKVGLAGAQGITTMVLHRTAANAGTFNATLSIKAELQAFDPTGRYIGSLFYSVNLPDPGGSGTPWSINLAGEFRAGMTATNDCLAVVRQELAATPTSSYHYYYISDMIAHGQCTRQ